MLTPTQIRESFNRQPLASRPGDSVTVAREVTFHRHANAFFFVVITGERVPRTTQITVRGKLYDRTRYIVGQRFYAVWRCDESGPHFEREVDNIQQAYYWRDRLAVTD